MTTSQEKHFIAKVEIVEVTNYFETTAYGTGHRPSGYKKEELEKHRQHHTVANFATTQSTLKEAVDMAGAMLKLLSNAAEEVKYGTLVPPATLQ